MRYELPASSRFYGAHKILVLPSVDRCAIDRIYFGEHIGNLPDGWPVNPTLHIYRRNDYGQIKQLSEASDRGDVRHELAFVTRGNRMHLCRLKIDNEQRCILWGEQPILICITYWRIGSHCTLLNVRLSR